MSPSSLRCLVLNAGGTYHPDKVAAGRWVRRTASAADSPDLAFIQEVPNDAWLEQWRFFGYRSVLGHERGWTVRSAILTRLPEDACSPLSAEDIPELEYHGEYVAAARLVGWGSRALTILSVHAQPAPTTNQYLRSYPDPRQIGTRDGGNDPRYAGQRFDADVVLETVRRCGPDVLACGDLNEARGWDDAPAHDGHTWGAEYLGRPGDNGQLTGGAMQAAGLLDIPLSSDGQEVATRRAEGHPSLQLDHILAGVHVAGLIRDAQVDVAWTQQSPEAAGLLDHAPIRFTLAR